MTEKKAGSASIYAYKYNNNGQLYSVTDKAGSSSIAKKYEYQYDLSGRITSRSLDGVKQISYNYDILNRPVKIRYGFDGQTFQTTHEYGMVATTTASKVDAGAFIGASMAYGMAVANAQPPRNLLMNLIIKEIGVLLWRR